MMSFKAFARYITARFGLTIPPSANSLFRQAKSHQDRDLSSNGDVNPP